MIGTLIYVLVVCIIIGLVFWIADYLPVPEPLNKLLKIVAIVIGVLIIIYALLSLGGGVSGLPSLK
jgi:preprotein translocase subunit SecE